MKKLLVIIAALMALTTMTFATGGDYQFCEQHPTSPICGNEGGGQDGVNGLSAYEIAQNNGFDGSATEWLQSLQGADGTNGSNGTNGTNGVDGATGDTGKDGKDGVNTYNVIYTSRDAGLVALTNEMQKQVDAIMNAYDELAEQGLNLSAGANAMAAIDFNADHKGHSIGFGYGFGNTWKDYRGGAGALGYQYAWTVNERDVSFVIKSWLGKQRSFGVGFGGVIGF